jgi:predicted O-methyltransferase YrrM
MKITNLFTAEQYDIACKLKEQDFAERNAGSTDPLRLKAVSSSVAQFLQMMILHGQARTVVELGTSAGYSTIHLAAAVQRTGGRVYTLDREPKKTAWAKENLTACGLDSYVEFFTGECSEFVDILPASLNFVFLDFGIPSFIDHWPKVRKKIRKGAMLFVDGWENLERWETEPKWKEFRVMMESDPDFLVSLLPLEKGHLIATRVK